MAVKAGMRIVFPLFDNVTQLDFSGPAQVLSRLGGQELVFVAKTREPIRTDSGFAVVPTATFAEVGTADMICVPGGFGTTAAMGDDEIVDWITLVGGRAEFITSVCTGSLLLGAAGLLRGYAAACHWQWRDQLVLFGADPVDERVVMDRNRITGGGVTAGIDFALELLALLRGEDHAKMVQLGMEYDPQPPFDAGSPAKAGPEMVTAMWERTGGVWPERRAQIKAIAERRGFTASPPLPEAL